MSFVHFDVYHRMVTLRKLYSMTLTCFSKVKDSNRDLPSGERSYVWRVCILLYFPQWRMPIQVDECEYCCTPHSSECPYKWTSASTAVLHTAANAHSSVTSSSSGVMKVTFAANSIPSKGCFTWQCSTGLSSPLHCTAFEGDAYHLTLLTHSKDKGQSQSDCEKFENWVTLHFAVCQRLLLGAFSVTISIWQ